MFLSLSCLKLKLAVKDHDKLATRRRPVPYQSVGVPAWLPALPL